MIAIDDSRWALVTVTWPEDGVSDADLEDFLAQSYVLVQRGRHGVLHIGIRASGLDSRQRRRVADHMKEHDAELSHAIVASAIVAESAVVFGMITAIGWLAPPNFPQKAFRVRNDAEAWLLEALRRAQ
jgi:hypothetical protein